VADLAITISNAVSFLGGSLPSIWGNPLWNAFKWGEGTLGMLKLVDKQIANSLVPDSALGQKDFEKVIANSLSPTSDMTSETLKDAAGYNYVFVSDTTNNEDRDIASYTSGTLQGTTWTSQVAGSTSWS